MLEYGENDFNCAIDLNLFALDYDVYDDTQLSFDEENVEEEVEPVMDENPTQQDTREREEPYTAY